MNIKKISHCLDNSVPSMMSGVEIIVEGKSIMKLEGSGTEIPTLSATSIIYGARESGIFSAPGFDP